VHSPDFSPLTSRRPSVVPTIEQIADGDNIIVSESGLLTPSKSQRSSTPALASAFDSMQSKAKGKGKPQKGAANQTKAVPKSKAAPKKATTRKVGRPAKGKAAKAAPIKPSASLKSSFSSSKGSVTAAEGKVLNSEAKKLPGNVPLNLPSKLREVSNQSPGSAHTTSPSDVRNKLSPTSARGTLPWLKKDLDSKAKRTMDLASVMN
jgi:hypothetical protein